MLTRKLSLHEFVTENTVGFFEAWHHFRVLAGKFFLNHLIANYCIKSCEAKYLFFMTAFELFIYKRFALEVIRAKIAWHLVVMATQQLLNHFYSAYILRYDHMA
jgi:hypothetical protein